MQSHNHCASATQQCIFLCAAELQVSVNYTRKLTVAQHFYGQFMSPANIQRTQVFT